MGKNHNRGQNDGGGAIGWSGERAAALDRMIGDLETTLQGESFKGTVADYIRLVQARRDLGEEQPSEVIVSSATTPAGGTFHCPA